MKIKIDKELFQWEKNRKVNIEASSDEPVITVVEFYNPQSKVADAVEVENGEAEIPNYLLKVPYPIMAVACTGEIGNTQAVDRREFRVIKRLRPENYIDEGSAPESPSIPPSSGGTGVPGSPGKDGEDGEDGATFTPYVSDEGILSWTNDKGLKNPASVNIMGPRGEQGTQGPKGEPGVGGADGYTPIKGVDYFTEDDKIEIVNQLSEKTYSKEEVDDKISKVNHLKRTIVSSSLDIDVTAEDAEQYVYMVPRSDALGEDLYDEYMVIEGRVEKVGYNVGVFGGATAETEGEIGLVPAPQIGDEAKFLKGDGTWAEAVIIDADLTVEGAAADAKKTGQRLSWLGSDVSTLEREGFRINTNFIYITGQLNQSDHPWYAVNKCGDTYLALGRYQYATSKDCVSWQIFEEELLTDWFMLYANNGDDVFICTKMTNSDFVLVYNQEQWTQVVLPPIYFNNGWITSYPILSLDYLNNNFIITTPIGILQSADHGTSWQVHSFTEDFDTMGVFYNNDQYFIVGIQRTTDSVFCAKTEDFSTWEGQKIEEFNHITESIGINRILEFKQYFQNNDIFILNCFKTGLMISKNGGMSWEIKNCLSMNDLWAEMAYLNGTYVLTGAGAYYDEISGKNLQAIAYSKDLENWSLIEDFEQSRPFPSYPKCFSDGEKIILTSPTGGQIIWTYDGKNYYFGEKNVTNFRQVDQTARLQEALKVPRTGTYITEIKVENWSNTVPATAHIEIEGIGKEDNPFVDVYLRDVADTQISETLEEWFKIERITTGDNYIEAYCSSEQPEINIPIILKVIE